MSGMVNKDLFSKFHGTLTDLIDRGFNVTYLSYGEGDEIVLDIEREISGLDWTISFEEGSPEKVLICYEILTGFDRFRTDYLIGRGGLSEELAGDIIEDLEAELDDMFKLIDDKGLRRSFSHWQTDYLHGFYLIDVDFDNLASLDDSGVGLLEDVWERIGDYHDRVNALIDEYGMAIWR